MAGTWSGRKVTNARKHWAARLPLPCRRCGKPVLATQNWHVGHIHDRALGGSDSITNTYPEHARCNTSAGGKAGAAITNARKAQPRTDNARSRGLRGP